MDNVKKSDKTSILKGHVLPLQKKIKMYLSFVVFSFLTRLLFIWNVSINQPNHCASRVGGRRISSGHRFL